MLGHVGLETAAELFHVLHAQSQAGGVGVSAEVLEQVAATLYGLVDIKSRHRAGRPCGHAFAACQHYGRPVVLFRQTRGDDADDSLVPFFVVYHHRAPFVQPGQVLHLFYGLFRHLLVQILAGLIVQVDAVRLFEGFGKVLLHQQFHGFLAVLHAPRGVDARANLEDDVVDGQFPVVQSAHLGDGLKADGGIGVELAQAVVGQDAVLAHDGDDVRGDAYGAEVEQRHEFVEFDAVAHGEGLHELESHPAARQVGIGIAVVAAFGVEDGHGGRYDVIGYVVVADDEVDAQFAGVCDFLYRLDAAVQYDDEFHPRFVGIVHTLARDAVAFLVAVRDVEVDVGVELPQKLEYQCHGGTAVHIIVSVDENAFLASHSVVEPFNGGLHVVHEEGVVQVGELGAEKTLHPGLVRDAAVQQQAAQCRVYAGSSGQFFSLGGGSGREWFVIPFVIHFMLFFSDPKKCRSLFRQIRS